MVQTLFSTDIIKYQDQNKFGDSSWVESFSTIALLRWLQVTLPLTALTLGFGYFFYKQADKKRQRAALLPVHEMPNKADLIGTDKAWP
jgi:hypothetical protein